MSAARAGRALRLYVEVEQPHPLGGELVNAWRRRVDAAGDNDESVCKFQSF